MNNIDLRTLLAPITLENFFDSYWPLEPLFIPGSKNKLLNLIGLPELQSVESIIQNRQLKVRACLPDFDDEYSSIQLEPLDALKAFRNNLTLVFESMQTQSEFILKSLDQIRNDLGLPTLEEEDFTQARAMAYATPSGGRTRLHFDANANFVVQLKGLKRWRLAPNNSVTNPTDRYTSGSGEISVSLDKQCHAPLLEEIPELHTEYILESGSVLYVPRGYWHETFAEEDSLSLTFTFAEPTWADIYARSIHQYLSQSEQWRELADGFQSSNLKRKQLAMDRFEIMVEKAKSELSLVDAKALRQGALN